MKLNRTQELYLINLGFKALMDKVIPYEVRNHNKKPIKQENRGRKGMSDAEKLRISKRMKAYWRKRRKGQDKTAQ